MEPRNQIATSRKSAPATHGDAKAEAVNNRAAAPSADQPDDSHESSRKSTTNGDANAELGSGGAAAQSVDRPKESETDSRNSATRGDQKRMGGRDSQRFGRSAGSFAWQVARASARTNAPNSAAWQYFIRRSYPRLMRITTRVSGPWQHSIRPIPTSRPSGILKSSSKYRPFSLAIQTIFKKSAADH